MGGRGESWRTTFSEISAEERNPKFRLANNARLMK
jgi:hypothetical protein